MSFSSSPGAGGTYNAFNTAAGAAMSGVHRRQEGFDFFGPARLGKSPVTVFALFQNFKPNTNFDPSTISLSDNPLDFQRFVAGVNFKVTNHFSVAVGDEHFRWVHPQALVTGGNTNRNRCLDTVQLLTIRGAITSPSPWIC
jgi:hypothetical protein